MGSRYLCNLTFIFFKFILKNFIFLEMVSGHGVTKHFLYIYIYICVCVCVFVCIRVELGTNPNMEALKNNTYKQTVSNVLDHVIVALNKIHNSNHSD